MKNLSLVARRSSLVILLISSVVLAEGKLADRVEKAYTGINNFTADFVQETYVEILDKTVVKNGRLAFSKDGRFFIHYTGDGERRYISDGKKLWVYRPADKEVEVYKDISGVLSGEALAFLGGMWELSKKFQIKVLAEERGLQRLELQNLGRNLGTRNEYMSPDSPDFERSVMKKIVLWIGEDFLVSEMTLYPKSGNKSHYTFKNIKMNVSLPDSTFEWKSKKGVREIL